MSAVEERAAFGTLLAQANLTPLGIKAEQVAWPNETFTPPKVQKPWMRVSFKSGIAFALELGKNGPVATHRHPGNVFVQIFVPLGSGDRDARTLAEGIATLLRSKKVSLTAGQVLTRTPTVYDVGSDGTYYQFNVSTPYVRDAVY